MNSKIRFVMSLLFLTASFHTQAALFGPKGNTDEEKRQTVRRQRDEMLAELFAVRPDLKDRLPNAAGYATFKQSDMNLFLLATGNGYGVLVDNKTGKETFMRVASLGGGVGIGIKDLRVVFVFRDPKIIQSFVDQGWQFGAKGDASAKYHDTGAAAEGSAKANVDFKEGTVVAAGASDARAGTGSQDPERAGAATTGSMEIYQFTESGLSLQATVAGTKYWKDKKLTQ